MAILLIFGGVIGRLASQRIQDDFDRELRGQVRTLGRELDLVTDPLSGQTRVTGAVDVDDYALPNGATVRIFSPEGVRVGSSTGAAYLGSPANLGIHDHGDLRVATAAVRAPGATTIAGIVQYARSSNDVDSTIERLWLFIAAGVLGGTLLATLAGLAIAERAMRPVASLTATARKIAATGDPSLEVPKPAATDEVAELANTLEDMLRALDSAQTERQAALDRQREFVADASHELRTPLTSVLANLEMLQEAHEASAGEEGEIVASALRSSRRMSRLVSDLLLLARADAGRSGERRQCNLAEIANSAADEVMSVAGSRRIDIYDGPPVPVNGNPDELHRLVLNLLENAVRHTPEDARVDVSISESDDGAWVVLDVADNGPGVPEELREQVFSRFVRGFGPADTAGRSGTGLGLAIVHAVATSHGGSVVAATSELGGALFRVKLPTEKSHERLTASLESL